jgi:hypothetical protein
MHSLSSTRAHYGNGDGAGRAAQAILDCSYLLPFLPLMGIRALDLIPQLMTCLQEPRLLSKGKLFTYFYIQCCHVRANLLR